MPVETASVSRRPSNGAARPRTCPRRRVPPSSCRCRGARRRCRPGARRRTPGGGSMRPSCSANRCSRGSGELGAAEASVADAHVGAEVVVAGKFEQPLDRCLALLERSASAREMARHERRHVVDMHRAVQLVAAHLRDQPVAAGLRGDGEVRRQLWNARREETRGRRRLLRSAEQHALGRPDLDVRALERLRADRPADERHTGRRLLVVAAAGDTQREAEQQPCGGDEKWSGHSRAAGPGIKARRTICKPVTKQLRREFDDRRTATLRPRIP